jgi:hypothetical protein
MDSTDMTVRRARLAYEWSRIRRAFVGSLLPVLVLLAVALIFGDRLEWTLAFGAGLFVLGMFMLWYGREPQRAVLPGIVAGMVPLFLVLCARHAGHFCTGTSCTTLCMQACALGGVLAGLGVASVGNARRAGLAFWISASAVSVLTGAMACSCLGISGIAGLAVGYVAGAAPVVIGRVFGQRRT